MLLLRFGTVAYRLFNIRSLVFAVRDGDHRRWGRSIVDCDRLLFVVVTAAVAMVYVTSTAAAVVMTAARSMMNATTAVHHHAATAVAIASVRRRRMVNLYIVRSTHAASTATHRSGIDRLIVMMVMVVSTATAAAVGLLQL